MKLKSRDLNEGEQKLEAADAQIFRDKLLRAGMLAIAIFGVAALAGVAVYLIWLSPPLQDSDQGDRAMRTRMRP